MDAESGFTITPDQEPTMDTTATQYEDIEDATEPTLPLPDECPVCNGTGWADGKGHYAATECGGLLLKCRACGGTGEVPCA